jgi:endogenous inhibitor of DNA gyrase (YacG/DUF329 family)
MQAMKAGNCRYSRQTKSTTETDSDDQPRFDSLLHRTDVEAMDSVLGGAIAILTLVFTESAMGSLPAGYHTLLVSFGALLAIGSFAFPCITIKCPACGTRWFWFAVSKKRSGTGIRWLFAQTACPVCGKSCRQLTEARATSN